jgi:anti-sigma factor RsiW
MHVDAETLVAYRDGELDEGRAARVRRHLETCERCTRALEELQAVWEMLAAEAALAAPGEPPPGGRERLQQAMEGWDKPQPDAELRRRADAQVETYFGSGVAASLDASAPLATMEPMLEAFLGRKATGAVVGQILKREDRACRRPGE